MSNLRSRVQYQQGTRCGRRKGISEIAGQGCAEKYHRASFVRTVGACRSPETARATRSLKLTVVTSPLHSSTHPTVCRADEPDDRKSDLWNHNPAGFPMQMGHDPTPCKDTSHRLSPLHNRTHLPCLVLFPQV